MSSSEPSVSLLAAGEGVASTEAHTSEQDGPHVTQSPRAAVKPNLDVVDEAPHAETSSGDVPSTEEATSSIQPLESNSLLLDVAPTAAPQEPKSETIPALESLTQLSTEFGANPSIAIICPVEDQPGA